MFKRLIKYNLLCTIRSKDNVFWLLLFPIILSVLFNIALSGILSDEGFETIPIAVVKDANFEKAGMMPEIIKSVSKTENGNKNENTLFHTEYVTKDEADTLLKDGDVLGCISFDETGKSSLIIKKNGISQTIIKKFLDIAEQKIDVANQTMKFVQTMDMATQKQIIEEIMTDSKEYIKPITNSENPPDTVVLFFYSILGMTCLYGANIGCDLISSIQSSQTPAAKRNCISPVSKMKIFLAGFISGSIVSISIVLVVLTFIAFVIGVDFGNRYPYVILTSIVGANTGLGLGCLLGAISKKDNQFKAGIVVAFTMICSFMAGMMNPDVKYQIKENAFIIDRLNPVNLITESYYKLYYYTNLTKYFENIAILLAMTVVTMAATIFILNRQEDNRKLERINL